MRIDTRLKLWTYLLKRGVYIKLYNNRYSMASILYNIITEEEQHKWTDQELVNTLQVIKSLILITL